MKTFVYAFLLFMGCLSPFFGEVKSLSDSDSTSNENWEAGTLDLRESYPIDIDPTLKAIVRESREEPLRNKKIIESKNIPWIAIAASILAISFIVYLKRRPKYVKVETPVAQSIVAHQEALQILNELKGQETLDPVLVQEFVKNITLALKNSFEEKFQLRTTIKTRQEFLDELEKDPRFTQELKSQVQDFLEKIDRIKFANYRPSFDECVAVKDTAENILRSIEKI